jgi:hypothetical protein
VPTLWKSRDNGKTWMRVNVGNEASGAIGNSDVDLAIARDGTLYFVTMVFDPKVMEGKQISIGVSSDGGGTWHWTLLSKNRFDDRPWVAVGADGTAHVIWNDGSGVCYAVSHDRGVTWVHQPRIHGEGGSSHLAVGPNREVAVRVTPLSASGNKFNAGVDLIAVSSDGGATWQKFPAPGQRQWSASFGDTKAKRWVEPVAWDARGALYSFWTEGKTLWLARSADRGKTWTSWRVAHSDAISYYPYLIGRARGQLVATWFSGQGDTLQAHVAAFDIGEGDAPPHMIESAPFVPDSWDGWNEKPTTRDTAGEYLALTFLRSGDLAVVTPIQNLRTHRFGFSWWRFQTRRPEV